MWLLWFFFFKQKTAYEMRISDWSSDVCSSDLDGGVDGVLLPPPLSDATEVIALFGEAEVPVVVVASARPPDRVSSVGIDDFEAARAMTRHLLAMGHDRIGFIVGNPNQHASARRLEGYRAALEARGAKVDDPLMPQGRTEGARGGNGWGSTW